MVVMYSFANLNMANWPPPDTSLKAACEAIVAGAEGDAWATLAAFLKGYSGAHASGAGCYNVSSQLPAGPRATISAGDCALAGRERAPVDTPVDVLRVACAVRSPAPSLSPQGLASARARTAPRGTLKRARSSSSRSAQTTKRTCSFRARGRSSG